MASYHIHLHRENWIKYGLGYKDGDKIAKNYFIQKRKILENSIENSQSSKSISDTQFLTNFENVYKNLISGSNLTFQSGNKTISYADAKQNAIRFFTTKIYDNIDSKNIGQYGEIKNNDQNLQNIKNQIGHYRDRIGKDIKDNGSDLSLDLVEKRFTLILSDLGQAIKALNKQEQNNLKDVINKVNKLYSAVMGTSADAFDVLYKKDGTINKTLLKSAIKRIKDSSSNGVIKNDSAIAKELFALYDYFRSPAYQLAQGTFAEDIGILTNKIINYNKIYKANDIKNGMIKEVKKELKNPLGSTRNKALNVELDLGITIPQETKKTLAALSEQKIINKDGNFIVSFGQQKVDIEITNPNSGLTEGVNLKSYNLKEANWIHLLSGSPLYTILLDNGNDFFYNYLNAQAAVFKENKTKSIHTDDSEIVTDNWVKTSNQALRMSIINLAFKGYQRLGTNQASIFAINDVSNGNFKLFDINTLIKKLYKRTKAFSIKIENSNNSSFDENLSKKTLSLSSYQSVEADTYKFYYNGKMYFGDAIDKAIAQRQAKILSDIHAQKVNVMINARNIKALM